MNADVSKEKFNGMLNDGEKLEEVFYPPKIMAKKIGLFSGVMLGVGLIVPFLAIFVGLFSWFGFIIAAICGICIGIYCKNFLTKLLSKEDALVYLLTDIRIVNSIDLGKLRKTSISIEYDKIQEIIVDTNIFLDFISGCSLVKLNTSSTIVSKGTGIYLSKDDAEDFKRKVETLKQKK